jgi:hypothetical protein
MAARQLARWSSSGRLRSSAPAVMSSRLTARAKALYAGDFDLGDGAGGFDEGAGGEESGEFVAGEEGAFEMGFAGDAGVVGVGEDGVEDWFGPALFAESFDTDEGMFFEGGVAFVVHVVEEAGAGVEGDELIGFGAGEVEALGFATAVGLGADGDGESVLAEALAFGPFVQEFEGLRSWDFFWHLLLLRWSGLNLVYRGG